MNDRFVVLTGHLNNYPLSDLIGILRHQRKSGRLLIEYPKGPATFPGCKCAPRHRSIRPGPFPEAEARFGQLLPDGAGGTHCPTLGVHGKFPRYRNRAW